MKTQGKIILRLDTVDQLVETSHPSPFPTSRLRTEAEQYIVERLADLPSTSTAKLIIALPRNAAVDTHHVTESVHEHFAFRRGEADKKLARVRQLGWRTLVIGLVFLSATILLVELMKRYLPAGNLSSVAEGGLTILAWVALWRPGELLLYEWYPFHRDAKLFNRLEHAEIEFIAEA